MRTETDIPGLAEEVKAYGHILITPHQIREFLTAGVPCAQRGGAKLMVEIMVRHGIAIEFGPRWTMRFVCFSPWHFGPFFGEFNKQWVRNLHFNEFLYQLRR